MRNAHVLKHGWKQPFQGGKRHTVGLWGETNTIERPTAEEGLLLLKMGIFKHHIEHVSVVKLWAVKRALHSVMRGGCGVLLFQTDSCGVSVYRHPRQFWHERGACATLSWWPHKPSSHCGFGFLNYTLKSCIFSDHFLTFLKFLRCILGKEFCIPQTQE